MVSLTVLTTLAVAGLFGAICKFLLGRDRRISRALVRCFIGISCAVFLGSFVSAVFFPVGAAVCICYSILASGFIIGFSSEEILALLTEKVTQKNLREGLAKTGKSFVNYLERRREKKSGRD